MNEKFIKSIVILLGVLIILAFFLLIYGMYTKISSKNSEIEKNMKEISLFLEDEDVIKSFEKINDKTILITIKNNDQIFGLIYDINKNKILQKITK